MKITSASNKAIDLIKSFEGLYLKPYLDPIGIPTIGYGTIRYPNGKKVTMADPEITEGTALVYLRSDLKKFELAVDAICTDKLTQNQFDALCSFCYNLGEGSLRTSTLAKKVNADPNDKTIDKEFAKWVYADGKKLNGLIRRRKAESDLYFS